MRALDRFEAKVCFKLYRAGCFGKGHKLIATMASGFSSHELDQVKAAILRLVRDGILMQHPTKHGPAVHIAAGLAAELYDALRAMDDYGWLPR